MDGLRLSIRVKDAFDAKLAQRIKLFSGILSEATRAIRRREGNLEQRCPRKFSGVSANLGMIAIVFPTQELERMGRSGLLSGAEQSFADARNQLSRIQQFLTRYLQEM